MMPSLWDKPARLLWMFALLVPVPAKTTGALDPGDSFRELTWRQLSDKKLSDWGEAALAIDPEKWRHGETTHFVIHFLRDGQSIGRRCELFYAEIRDFFGNRTDLPGGQKAHVFAFRDPPAWAKFAGHIGQPRAAGITRGNEFFYLATVPGGQFDSKAKVQFHEMTHLVFNRFFIGQLPLWLNEGIAEYFGQRQTSSIVDFRRTMGQTPPFDLDRLFASKTYPRSPLEVQAFYAEAAIVIDFLTKSPDRRALLPRFVDKMIERDDIDRALAVYGYKDFAEFKSAYKRYRLMFR